MQEKEAAVATAYVKTEQIPKRGIGPAIGLFFTAPLVAEFLLGNLPIKMLPALILLAPMYGGGALLIRETVRKTGRGWPSIILLGMAYAIFEEAFTTQSLFNPNYLHLNGHFLAPAHIAALGIGGWWTLWMFNVHAVWSIATPIALIEASVPERSRTPWLPKVGLAVVAILFAAGSVALTLLGYRTDHFVATAAQFTGAAVVVVALVAAALMLPRTAKQAVSGQAPGPWVTGAVALALGSLALLVPQKWGWGAVASLFALDIVLLLLVLFWSRRSGWALRQKLGLAAGAALAYGWHAFLQHPAVGPADMSVRVGNAIFLLGALALIGFAASSIKDARHGVVHSY